MAPLSLKIILDDGAVTKTLMFDTTTKVWEAHQIVRDKILALDPDKEYGFFLTSADNDDSGIWLSNDKKLEYYMLKDGDSVLYLTKIRNLRLRMLDGHVKVLQVDESNNIENLMVFICQKIGVANHEEYGLCRVDDDTVEDTKPNMGTLTLKKNTKVKEKDVQLEQLRKKFKTDDNVEWLEQMKTLRECRVNPNETLLFKRRLFYSDRNVDSRDPVQLNLLYVQTRDAILDGRQVVTVDKAAEFAGIQCQIQYGDFLEEKHKPGFIENLKEFLPEQYASSWGIEKKINSLHRKHQGLSQIEAKHLYTKTARELPTYGVTFFLVKEKHKGKKKLIPRLLGINSESILRLDEETKEILQVWPLTQIKSYKAGSESFTLNFGDYSEKEYAVKTNDAMRIRDILQGYIDIIRKRLAAPYNVSYTEGETICEDMVESSRGTLTQNVVASKVIEHSLVGPSQIIAVEQGQQSQHGTRIMTVHEIITTTRTNRSQQPMRGELRSSLKYDFRKKLNHLNSEAVKTVMLLSDPTNENIQEVRRMVAGFEDALPSIMKGVNETAASLSEEESKKLLGELDELCAYINSLASSTKRSNLHDADSLLTAQDAATKIAELSTQMCFSLDPKTRKRSKYLTRSRQSFIMDEKTEASIRRASFITAADGAFQAVQQAQDELNQEYHVPCLSDMDIKDLERKTVARMGKLNAAIALLLNAHADSKNIDYEMAINSMQTINKIIPELIKDAQLLTRVGDEDTKSKLRGQVMQLLDGTRAMCQLTGTDDVSKMQDKGNDYADVSKKLIFTFSRPDLASSDCNELHDKENEILELTKDVGQKISSLLMVANDLTNYDPHDPHATDLDIAGAKCADATQGLLSCAKLTAPSIQEPHCQSALTTAAENLSSAVQNMTLASKPLVEKPGRHGFASQLAEKTFDFAKALDRLKNAYSNLNANNIEPSDESETEAQGIERLKFIMSTARNKRPLIDADKKLQALNQLPVMMDTGDTKSLNIAAKRLLSQRLGQLNGAIASFLQSTSDPENTDYETAGAAIKTICKLTPHIIDETKALHGSVDENTWNDIMENLRSILEATQEVCANAENGDIKEVTDAASKLASSSGKLIFVFNPRSKAKKKNQVLDLSKQAIEETSQLLSKIDQLSQKVEKEQSNSLDNSGAMVKDAANNFSRTVEITTPTLEQASCKVALLHATNRLSNRAQSLQASWKPITQIAEYHHTGQELDQNLNRVQNALDKVRVAVQNDNGNMQTVDEEERRKFKATLSSVKNAMDNANKALSTPNEMQLTVNNSDVQATKNLLSKKMANLNTAIANLLQATSDNERPDYEAAAAAINAISNLTPDIIKDAKTLQGTMVDKSWNDVMENLKSMVETTNDICANVDHPQDLNDLAINLANSAKQLTYVFHPNRNINKENKILDLSKATVKDMSVLLSNVYDVADEVGGVEEENLDIIGIRTVNSTQVLLKTAEITAPNIGESVCQKSLLSAIDSLSKNFLDLQNCWEPLVQLPKHRQTREQLDNNLKQVQSALAKLKGECQGINVSARDKTDKLAEEQEKQRLQFVKTLSVAKESMAAAHKELKDANNLLSNRLSKSEDNAKAPMQKMLLSQKLARLNAAIADLYQATSDRENPNYKEAIGTINFISNITPNILKDVKSLRGSVDDKSWRDIMENLKSIVDATSDIYANAEDPEKLHESASELANSAGRLRFIFVPRKNTKKENQILDLSKSLVEEASVLLSHVYQVTESVDGEEGEKLDTAGVKVVDAAQTLLKTAEFTAPSMEDLHCQETMMHAIDRFSGRSIDLQNTWKPLAKTPKYHQITKELDQELNQVHSTMDKLKEACRDIGGNETVKETPEQQKQRIQFIETLSTTQNAMAKANKELKEANNLPNNVTTKTVDKSIAPATKKLLSQKLAHLNAAIASLLQATSNHDNPDYETAAAAMNAISNLTPDIIKDTKSLHGTVDDKSWANIMESLKSIVDSTNELCANTENPQELKESASKFANSVGRLSYVFNPRKNIKKENQILDLSKTAVEETSVLLSNVYQLEVGVGGEEGEKLDSVGVKVVESAQMLLKTAEITAPSIEDLRCQETLLSAIDHLSGHARDLQNTWKPLTKTPEYQQTAQQLDRNLNQVNSTLDKLRDACRDVGGNEAEIEAQEQEKQRRHFIATLSSAKNAMLEANTELKEANSIPFKRMSKSVDKSKARETKKLLSQKLARLNAAIADLLQATSSNEKPDYKAAAEAINNISHLTQDVIKDTKTLYGTVDDKSWDKIMESLKSMVDTTNAMCANNENPQELKDSASKFANSVGRLTFVFNPRKNVKKENQILDLSKRAVEETSVLLSNVYQLTEKIGGEEGEKLDTAGVKVVDSAQMLLNTAEITSSSIDDAHCQKALFAAIDHLADRAQDLQNTWKPIVYTPEYKQSEKELENNLDQVKSTLAKLKQACLGSNVDQEEEKQHLQFADMLSTAKNSIKDATNDLKDIDRIPIDKRASKSFDKKNVSATKKLLSAKLAQLNAAIASLLQATSDRERPDYDAAAKAVNAISNLTPQIIKDTKTLHGVVDDKSWKTMVDNLKIMVATTNDICNNTENPQELKDIATKFANSAGRLTYVFNPHNNAKKENQIRDLSRCAVEQTSLLLSNVYQLTEKVGGEEGEKLDVAGVKVVESANMLLKTAEITSPNISDSHCQAALLSSVDKMYSNTEDLKNTWQPLVLIPQYQSTGDQLEQNVKIVYATLEKLKKACQDTEDSKDCKPDQLLKNISEAHSKIKEVENLFSEDKIAQRALEAGVQDEKTSEKPILARRTQLSNKLAQLNDSIALLIQAMLDRENPDYMKAEQSISIISNLTPEIIQETMALQRNLDDNSRSIVFDEAKAVCEASQEICTSVENNSLEDLNNAATKYAQSSGKLRYIISPRSYPNKEKKILDVSRSACERTSLMLSRVSRLAGSDSSNEGERMSLAGAKVADAAHSLFTNAQIISPSIEDRNCQSTLSESADRLMKIAQNLEKIWKPIVLKPQHHQIGEQLSRDINLLNSELDRLKEICHDNSDLIDPVKIQQQTTSDRPNTKPPPNPKPNMDDLDNILQSIQKNVAGDAKKPKVEERILIEDTPLRKLALKIMESAKVKASEASSSKDRERFSQFANELAAATHKLDIANAKCRDAPFDAKDKSEKAFQLENAVLNLQLLCIQSRQSDGQQSNIVDLTDFVKDVTFAVDDLNKTAKGIKQEHGREALMGIKEKCQKIQHDADELMKPQEEQNENMFEYMLKTGQFAKDCDIHVKEITAAIHKIDNEASKLILLSKLRALTDTCNLLSFAAQSSISNGQSATLEGSLQNLGEVEKRIEVILKPNEGFDITKDTKGNTHVIQAAQSALTAVVASGNENELPAALTRYAVNIRGLNNTDRNSKLKDHLQRLMDILKMQIGDKNRRILTWQEVTEGEETKITEKILEELQSFAHDMQLSEMPGVKTTAPIKQVQLIKDVDVKRLLAPSGSHEVGDEKELTAKLNQQILKLNSMANMIPLSLHKPESLSRSLHSTSEAAIQLASIARGLKHQDPVQNKRIEEAAQEMSVATYNLLKTAESVGRSSNQPESRRRLLDAYKALNDTLNNLAKTTSTKNPMQRDCNEMARTIQLQQSFLSSEYPSCALNYVDCLNALQNQQEVIQKLQSEQVMSRTECSTELRYVTSAICNSMEYASQTAYLVSLSNEDQNIATVGMADVPRIKKLTDSINETCLQIICNDGGKEATEQANLLDSQVHQLEEAVDDASTKVKEDEKNKLTRNKYKLLEALKGLNTMLRSRNYEEEQIMPTTMKVIDALNDINITIDRIPQPKIDKDPKKIQISKEVIDSTKSLMTSTSTMLKKASSSEVEKIKWGMIGSSDVIKSFEALLTCIREKGVQAGYVKPLVTTPPKSYVQTQVDLGCYWLKRPAAKESDKAAGIGGVEKLVQMAEEMCNDLQGGDKEELKHVVHETKQLLKDCTVKYNSDRASVLMDRLRELRKMLERGAVTRVVEDFLEEEPLANLEALHKENDEKKRKFLLEKKIAELLAQLGRITKTARFVADTAVAPRQELLKTSGQVELLAPALVKAAEERIHRPDDKATIEHYQKLLAEYAESLSKVRDLCDRAVDPIDFTQAAGETMQRMKEESFNDPHKSVHNSQRIMKLCNRVIEVSMDSDYVQKDPEIKKTLVDIKRAVEDKFDKHADWKDITAEFMRRTGEVESVLGGENIFLRQPEPDQPIYAAALDLHAAVRDWSARDNEIVAVAKRMAVQMARLSDYMNTGRTRELIVSSNTIISLSKEVSALARKLALECSDIRIRTNLQQVCDRIPTISGQLKMLTTVKGSSLGHQDTAEDKEAMTMLVGNAQNLMKSIQEVVKAAASASVKIMSQKGYSMKWKRRNYY